MSPGTDKDHLLMLAVANEQVDRSDHSGPKGASFATSRHGFLEPVQIKTARTQQPLPILNEQPIGTPILFQVNLDTPIET